MRKLWFFLIAAAMLLSACSQGAGSNNSPSTPGQGNAVPTANPSAPKMECTIKASVNPTPDPTLQAKFPPKVEGDWTHGNPGATMSIIEYSDYM